MGTVEEPPWELAGLADEIHVVFPWAALLRGLLRPDPRLLRGLSTLAKPGARFELVLTYDAAHDHGAGVAPSTPSFDLDYMEGLRDSFAAAGLEILDGRLLTVEEALAIPSTWGHRLLHGLPREVFLVRATCRQA